MSIRHSNKGLFSQKGEVGINFSLNSFNIMVAKFTDMIKNDRFNNTKFTFYILFLLFLFSGCIKDDLNDCPKTYRLVVQTDPNDDVSLRATPKVVLFIFDENNRLLDYRNTSPGVVMELSYEGHSRLNAVAWANIDDHVNVSTLNTQMPLENATVKLIDRTDLSEGNYALSPSDLFHGKKELDLNLNTQEHPDVLIIGRKVAAIQIIAKKLKEYVGTIDNDFTYKVKSSKNTFDFNGKLMGDDRNYLPECSFSDKDELIAPAFLVFPSQTGQNISVDIYKGTNLIYTIDKDDNGLPLKTEEGKILELIVDFSTEASVDITIKDWDAAEINQEF